MTDATGHPAPSKLPEIRDMSLADIGQALAAGWRDFRTAPVFGLVFGAVYATGGWGLYLFLFATDLVWLALPITVGFPLLGPFAAVGLYEISRRLESGTPWTLRDIFGVIWRQTNRQLPLMSWLIIIYFLFWSFFAHMLFAFFLGPSALMNVTSSYAFLLEPEGLTMLLVGSAFGAVFAALLFALTVVSLPLLLDKEIDFVTAMLTSLSVVRHNPVVMWTWAAVIAAITFAAMVPGFLGLLIALPVLGHASWHIYRAALSSPDGE
ncbi:DUF2189 domain-containing protein [Rhodobacterales bacterium HKCCE3408]|nr:DUF2189 domain-containing protein [Rhodobacterales bacterium HKCCE3408]